jgi:hypothetical protein
MPLHYAGDPLGKRRPIVAQRFNLAGGARVLYLAEDQVTSLHEIQAFGWPPTATAVVPVQFDLKAVIDLRDPNVQTNATNELRRDRSEFSLHRRGSGTNTGARRAVLHIWADRRPPVRIPSDAPQSQSRGFRGGANPAAILDRRERSQQQSL